MPLITDLHDAFTSMEGGDDKVFAEGITAAVQKSFEMGKLVATVYNGSCSLGVSSGTVAATTSTIDASGSRGDCYDIIIKQCDKMKKDAEDAVTNEDTSFKASDDDLMVEITKGISAMVTGAKITEVLSGTVVPPSVPPPTVPAAGTGEGAFDDPGKSALETALKLIPPTMGAVPGGDMILATGMGTAILAYFATCIANMDGQGALAGLSGTNVMVGNL